MALSYEEYPKLEIPNTTNLLEGFNSQLKRALHNHHGRKETNKKKFIDGFLNMKKQIGITSFYSLPLLWSALL